MAAVEEGNNNELFSSFGAHIIPVLNNAYRGDG